MTARPPEASYDRSVVVLSLAMHVDVTPDGRYAVIADWMEEPFVADTWEACYEEALRQRRNGTRRTLDAAAE